MFYSTLLITAAALCGLASAQNYSANGSITVDPNSVPIDLRQAWCRSQTASCISICGNQGVDNQNCIADTLVWSCDCADHSSHNFSSYEQTIPFFECQQWKSDCVAANPNNLTAQTTCLAVTCGTRNASAASGGSGSSASASASSSATGGSPTQKGGSTGTGGAAAATSTGAAVALGIARDYGTGILVGGLLAVFGLAL